MEKLTYKGNPDTKAELNSCGGGANQLEPETVGYLKRTMQDKFKQIFIMEDSREIVGTVKDIYIVSSK